MKGEILSIETTQYIQELKNTIESQSDIIQELQERIDKAIEYINKMFETGFYNDDYYLGKLKKILSYKEV